MSSGTHRVQHFHQPLERDVLVSVRRQVPVADPAKQLRETRVTREVRPQHQRVDEESDQVMQPLIITTGHRHADRDIGAAAGPGEQEREPACSTMNSVT